MKLDTAFETRDRFVVQLHQCGLSVEAIVKRHVRMPAAAVRQVLKRAGIEGHHDLVTGRCRTCDDLH